MKDIYEELKALVDYIQSVYTSVTEEWLLGDHEKINLMKYQVADIRDDDRFYRNIIEYVQFLNEKSAEITLQLSVICSCSVTARVKTQNSIEYKIRNYKTEKHENGKIAINKCINDLFGFRIILDTPLSLNEIRAYLNRVYSERYRCIDSSKLEYKAVHLYFKENNIVFPWELQVWKRCDVETNFASHKKYKQEYTTWEKESKEGGMNRD